MLRGFVLYVNGTCSKQVSGDKAYTIRLDKG